MTKFHTSMLSDSASEPSPGKAEIVSVLELYKLARAQIEHENILVGQRITWYLTLQGFLLTAAFVTAATLLDPAKSNMHPAGRCYLAIAIGLLCFLGIVSSIACFLLIRAAYVQIDRVVTWWSSDECRKFLFPEITGTGGCMLGKYRVTGADFVLLILLTWAILLVFLCLASAKGT